MAPASKPTTTIRMGAAHYDLTVLKPDGQTIELDLTKARWPDKTAMARHLCAAYDIEGTPPHNHRTGSKRKGSHKNGKHKSRHQLAGQLSGKEPIRQAPAGDGPKKRSRRRRASGAISASGPAAH